MHRREATRGIRRAALVFGGLTSLIPVVASAADRQALEVQALLLAVAGFFWFLAPFLVLSVAARWMSNLGGKITLVALLAATVAMQAYLFSSESSTAAIGLAALPIYGVMGVLVALGLDRLLHFVRRRTVA